MAEVINMPRLSDTMEEGTVATWLKKVGDKVEEGDILAEIETDKATMEFESFNEGVLLHIGIEEGKTAPVDTLLAIIGEEGEDISGLLSGGGNDSASTKEDPAPKEEIAPEESSVEAATSEAPASVPDGVIVVTMPRLSDTMEEGTVATWLKKVGDKVEEGDILAEIETDKATMEFESFNEGTLLHIGLEEGSTAKVDALLAVLGPEGTDVSGVVSGFKSGGTPTKTEAPKKETPKKETPKAAEKKIESPETATSSSSSASTSSSSGRIFASPLAKKIAEEKGINLAQVKGSGENGRIVKSDVENFVPSAARASAGVAQFVATGEESFEEIENSQMRKAIARGLSNSKFNAPHYYLNVEFNMENMMAFRKQFNALPDTKVSYNDMIIKAVSVALKQHPQVNSQWFDDRMRLNHHVHIGQTVV